MPDYPRRKPIRLHLPLYAEPGRVFSLTLCTRLRQPAFAKARFAETCVDLLKFEARQGEIALLAYCVMPDHVHLLAGPQGGTSLTEFVGRWKRRTDYEYRSSGGSRLWQRSFFDHALRQEESIEKVSRYILDNPVRAGLVEDWRDYAFSGSVVLGIDH